MNCAACLPLRPDGWTPLMGAAQQGFADIVDTLLSAGAKAAAANAGGTTVLMLAAGGGHRHKLFPCSVRTKGI